jgi:hypothetical protein
MVIRHGEKPGAGAGAVGTLLDGGANAHALTIRGWQRAGALAVLFSGAVPRVAPVSRPTRLLAPDYGADAAAHRPVQTLQPIAERLGLRIEAPCSRDRPDELILRHVLGHGAAGAGTADANDVVLICWDHENIAGMVAVLATAVTVTPAPMLPDGGWPDDRYDVVLAFTRADDGGHRYAFAEIPQQVLSGDSPLGLRG